MLTLLPILVPLLGSIQVAQGLVRTDGVGKLPALGWNSWNAYACNISEDHFISAAQKMVSLGLKDAGYEYVNIDDCYSVKDHRDPVTDRILPDPIKFPDGINGTAQKIHDMGLKIGIYSSAGTTTCAGYPASLGKEELDAQTFADWGIDYLKYDNCNYDQATIGDECDWCLPDQDNHMGGHTGPNGTCQGVPHDNSGPGKWCPDGYNYTTSNTFKRYAAMRDAILKTNRPMLYSLCEWGTAKVEDWGAEVAQSWRSTGDIQANWDRIKEILNENSFFMNNVEFYGHPDPDMLEVGNGLSNQECRTHFALWAVMKSPLLIGTDLAKLDDYKVGILKNKYLLAFNQDDETAEPAAPYKWGTNPDWTFNKTYPAEFWSGKFKQGTLVLAMNTQESFQTKTIDYSEIPELDGSKAYTVIDAWKDKVLGCYEGSFDVNVAAHDTHVFLMTDECTPTSNSSATPSPTTRPSHKSGFIAKEISA